MKSLINWLTKGTKIRKILEYIYKGLYVAEATLATLLKKMKEVKPDWDIYPTCESIIEYMKIAKEAVKKVLDWLGANTDDIEKEAEVQAATDTAKSADEKDALSDITDLLKQEIK